MKNIEGYLFFDKSLEIFEERIHIFGSEKNHAFSDFETNLKTFQTPNEAANAAKQYYWKYEKRNPNPILSKLKMKIPESLREEEEFLEEKELIIIVPKTETTYTILLGNPTDDELKRYCNNEVKASRLIYNRITPYHPIMGETAYEIASEARNEIIRQSQQTGILIATFSLRKLPNSRKLIYYP